MSSRSATGNPLDPGAILRQAWATAHVGDDAQLDELLEAACTPEFEGAAALIPEEAVMTAVLSVSPAKLDADQPFRNAFPDAEASPNIRRLAGRARRNGQALGLLETVDGAVVAAWAIMGERAKAWARSPAAAAALERAGAVLLLTFAPSQSDALAEAAAEAFALTPLEARLAEAFLFAPTLEVAAEHAGVGRETARDAMARIVAKTGVRRARSVVRRLTELMSAVRDQGPVETDVLIQVFGLTPAEAETAMRLVAGATQSETAVALGLSLQTVRGYAKAALQKSGAGRIKDLARVAPEAQALARFRDVTEPVFVSVRPAGRLRLMPRGRRNIAFLDYGPRSGEPAVVFHGFLAGRSLPPALVRNLQQRGRRPIVVQRPGFGLTTAANRDYLETAADDLADVLDFLGLTRIALFARDGGTAAALAFASRNPDRIARGVLLNPRTANGPVGDMRSGPVAHFAHQILANPQVIEPLGDFIRKRTRTDVLRRILRETLRALPQDLAALDEPGVELQLIRDIQAQFAHSSAGYVAEHALYTKGWSIPRVQGDAPWTIAESEGLSAGSPHDAWLVLPRARFLQLAGAGVLPQFTHADVLASLISGE